MGIEIDNLAALVARRFRSDYEAISVMLTGERSSTRFDPARPRWATVAVIGPVCFAKTGI